MTDQTRKLINSDQGGLIKDVLKHVKLVVRLMLDHRVNGFIKLIPIASLVYLIMPIDLIPAIPFVSALDDAAVLWLASSLFIELCPPEVVQEYKDGLNGTYSGDSGEVIDAETRDINS